MHCLVYHPKSKYSPESAMAHHDIHKFATGRSEIQLILQVIQDEKSECANNEAIKERDNIYYTRSCHIPKYNHKHIRA